MRKITLISLACIGLASLSANAENLKNNLAQCAKVNDSLARLVCFDDLAKKVTSSSDNIKQETIAGSVIKRDPVIAPSVSKEANFGAEHLKKTNVSEEDLQVVFVVETLKKDQYGRWRFTFKNGQQWKQSDSGYFKVKVGESVLLKKGVLDAVYLKKNDPDSNRKIRVKRVK